MRIALMDQLRRHALAGVSVSLLAVLGQWPLPQSILISKVP